jgi:hypothetical protein
MECCTRGCLLHVQKEHVWELGQLQSILMGGEVSTARVILLLFLFSPQWSPLWQDPQTLSRISTPRKRI